MKVFRQLALITALATFLLIAVGGVVRVSGSGLGCPDWPTCHGQVVPPLMLHAIIEYSHRFVASLVTVLIAATAGYTLLHLREQRWLVIPASVMVVLLVAQIPLGAVTVETELRPLLVTTHLATALALFAMTVVVAATARWIGQSGRRFALDGFALWALTTLVLTYVLLLAGSFVVATASSYTCGAWPLCGNGIQLPTDGRAILNVGHRLMGGLVALSFAALVGFARTRRLSDKTLFSYLVVAALLLVAQIAVGAGIALWRVPPFTAALHLVIAAAFWGDIVVVTILACLPNPPIGSSAQMPTGRHRAFLERVTPV